MLHLRVGRQGLSEPWRGSERGSQSCLKLREAAQLWKRSGDCVEVCSPLLDKGIILSKVLEIMNLYVDNISQAYKTKLTEL